MKLLFAVFWTKIVVIPRAKLRFIGSNLNALGLADEVHSIFKVIDVEHLKIG
jgi:hypothetical protein